MQIKMKQAEITAALRQYIGGQGINLAGRSFEVEYTAGRKEAGLLADISIEIIEGADPTPAPAAVQDEAEKKSPETAAPEASADSSVGAATTVSTGDAPAAVAVAPKAGIFAALKEDTAPATETLSDRPLGEIPVSPPAVKTSSLFGSRATA